MEDVKAFCDKVNRYIAERQRLDLTAVYDKLKDQYPLVLTNTFSLENGMAEFGEDFDILCGESEAGRFQLYDNGLYIVFDVDKSDGTYTHWHPSDILEAIEDIREFMEGKSDYDFSHL